MIVTLIAAMSADGFIAQSGDQSSLDWTSKEDTRFFVEKTKEIGTVVMGRKTFGTIGRALPGRRTIVMSAKGRPEDAPEGVEYSAEAPNTLVARLAEEGVGRVAICGGASVYAQFLTAGLVDELFLTVEPVLFGSGIPLAPECGRIDLELMESRALGDRAVLHHYRANRPV